MGKEFSLPEYFVNRELSWLGFNKRVLEEAQDPRQPLLERVKFLSIVSSNLDEFFEIRVAGIKQQIENKSSDVGPDGLSASKQFESIRATVTTMVESQYKLWNRELVPALAEHGIRFHEMEAISEEDRTWARQYFLKEVFPVLTPLGVDASHPFPQLANKSHNIIVQLQKRGKKSDLTYAIVPLPHVLPRLIRLPRPSGNNQWDFIFLKLLIKHYVGELFPGLKVQGAHAFRITRNSDLYIDEEEAENLLRTIENELKKRNRGNAVRLEVQADCPPDVTAMLLEMFRLTEADLYRLPGPLTFLHLTPLVFNDAFPELRDRPFFPSYDLSLPPQADVFEVLRRQDVLLHHPYESFDSVVQLLETAAADPRVLAIKMTLYRTSGDSPVVRALIDAANKGKQVTALVELKARFDEANNIQWARQLEEAGVHVVYGVVGLKVHCKALLIVRRDEDQIRRYVQLGTGNYHPRTARIYTDLSFCTAKADITNEVAVLFNTLTGVTTYPRFKKLMLAPFDLFERLMELIKRERDLARSGKPGRIILKINSLVEEELIRALYAASNAGVKIDLIVRGICCLRPGIKGVSENIRVISIVGRFLEHSRIFYFGNNGDPAIYLSSADLMPRNLYRRIETAFPIEDPALKTHIEKEILPAYLSDRVKARQMQPDGSYVRLKAEPGQKPAQAQLTFRELSRRQIATINQADPRTTGTLTPLRQPPAHLGRSGNEET